MSVNNDSPQNAEAGNDKGAKALKTALADPKLRALLDEDQITELQGVFSMFDCDNSGAIDVKELKQVMQNLGMNPTDEEVSRMM